MSTQCLLAAGSARDAHGAYRHANRQCSTAASDLQRYLPLSALLILLIVSTQLCPASHPADPVLLRQVDT